MGVTSLNSLDLGMGSFSKTIEHYEKAKCN